jgi:hypothetical protein
MVSNLDLLPACFITMGPRQCTLDVVGHFASFASCVDMDRSHDAKKKSLGELIQIVN